MPRGPLPSYWGSAFSRAHAGAQIHAPLKFEAEIGEDYRFPSLSPFEIVMSRLGDALNVFDINRRNYPFSKPALHFHNTHQINLWKTKTHQETRQPSEGWGWGAPRETLH